MKFDNMEKKQAQVPITVQTWPPLAAPGQVSRRHQQVAPRHGDVAHGAECAQLHQNQTRVEQLISKAYNKVQGQDTVILTPKRRRVEDEGAGNSDRGEVNVARSWEDTDSFDAQKTGDQNTPRAQVITIGGRKLTLEEAYVHTQHNKSW